MLYPAIPAGEDSRVQYPIIIKKYFFCRITRCNPWKIL